MCERECKRTAESVTLATELLREVKASARRWFIAFCVMCFIEVATICGFLWYISLPTEVESTDIQQEADEGYNQVIGGDYNVSETESNKN